MLARKATRACRILNGLKGRCSTDCFITHVAAGFNDIIGTWQKRQRPSLDSLFSTSQLREHFDRLKVWQNRKGRCLRKRSNV